jgi:hypothetical protein
MKKIRKSKDSIPSFQINLLNFNKPCFPFKELEEN